MDCIGRCPMPVRHHGAGHSPLLNFYADLCNDCGTVVRSMYAGTPNDDWDTGEY
jgi:hypothetical protein